MTKDRDFLPAAVARLRKAGYAVGGHDDYKKGRPASPRILRALSS